MDSGGEAGVVECWEGSRRGVLVSIVALLASGCADEIDHDEFTEDLCSFGAFSLLAQSQPAEPVDGAELRDASQTGNPDAMDGWLVLIPETFGDPCGGASDREACEEAYGELPYESTFTSSDLGVTVHRTIAYGRGDEVGVVASTPELLEFLGTIDAPGDAALRVVLDGHVLACDGNDVGERADGTFVVHTRSGGCSTDLEEHLLVVHPDGTIETEVTEVVEKADPACSG